MPIENRSSNTEMVSVPEGYMLVERSIWTERQVEAATACITRLKDVPSITDRDLAMAAIDAAQCTAPDIALCDLQPALQQQGEPVAHARICWVGFDSKGKTVSMEIGVDNMPVPRKVELGEQLIFLDDHRREVDRLRAELAGTIAESKRRRNCCADLIAERDTLRAQLAERDALLNHMAYYLSPALASHQYSMSEDAMHHALSVLHRWRQLRARTEPSDECAHSYANELGCPECGEAFGRAEQSALPDPLGCNGCTHAECGKFDGPHKVECRAMADNACARPGASS